MSDSDEDVSLRTPYFSTTRNHLVKTLIEGFSIATRISIKKISLDSQPSKNKIKRCCSNQMKMGFKDNYPFFTVQMQLTCEHGFHLNETPYKQIKIK